MTSSPPGGPSRHHEPATASSAERPSSSSFFRWLRDLDVTRTSDRWVGGVAGGLARRTGLDPALVRGLIVVLAIVGGVGVLLYGLAWALLPEPDGRIHVEQAGRGAWTSGLSGATALVALGLWRPDVLSLGDSGTGGVLWTFFWIGAVVLFVYWIVNRSKAEPTAPTGHAESDGGEFAPAEDLDPPSATHPAAHTTDVHTADVHTADDSPPTLPYNPAEASWSSGSYGSSLPFSGPAAPHFPDAPPRSVPKCPRRPSGSATALLIGSAILTAGILLALDYAGVLELADPAVGALAAAAVVLSLGIMVLGARGRTSGMVGLVAALTTASALVTSFSGMGGAFILAQQTSDIPTSLRAAESGYNVMVAEATIDLTALPEPAADMTIPVNALVSDVTVLVPEDVPVEVRMRVPLGSVNALGTTADIDEPAPFFDDDRGVLQLTTSELNPEASGPAFVLDVKGALSDISIITAPAVRSSTSGSSSTGDTP